MIFRFLSVFVFVALLCSCEGDKKQTGGPIILGDSSTIVTETDPKYLSDFVDDIQLRSAAADTLIKESDTLTSDTTVRDTIALAATVKETASETNPAKGLNIEFKEVTVFIPDIQTKTYRQQDLQKTNGATYQLTGGKIQGNELKVSGATITKVSQRYITKVSAKTGLGTLQLDALSHTTEWREVKGKNSSYTISGLDRPQAKEVTPAQIRLAVSRSAKNARLSKKNIQNWEKEVRNVRSLNQKPFELRVGSVMWKIEGKDAQGKSFQKQIRIDL